jgi:hypothetical protein
MPGVPFFLLMLFSAVSKEGSYERARYAALVGWTSPATVEVYECLRGLHHAIRILSVCRPLWTSTGRLAYLF